MRSRLFTLAPLVGALFATGCVQRGWVMNLNHPHNDTGLAGAGVYQQDDGVRLNLDSITPVAPQPSTTSKWAVVPDARDGHNGVLLFDDDVVSVTFDKTNEIEPLSRKVGTIAALAMVNQTFNDFVARAKVNVKPHEGGNRNRQGVIGRWDVADQYNACYADFGDGFSYIVGVRNEFTYAMLGRNQIKNFDPNKAYVVEYRVVGDTHRCRVLDGAAVVADTGDITDKEARRDGAAGIICEISLLKPSEPLHCSASNASVIAIGPVPTQASPTTAQVNLSK